MCAIERYPGLLSWILFTLDKEANMMETNPSRRTVIHGALAACVSVFIPGALLGCSAKKESESTDPAPAAPPATQSESATPEAPGKASQASVHYQSQPKGELKCEHCMHFNAGTNSCQVVDGQISASGWCSLWTAKA
jgi:hypothetical protein